MFIYYNTYINILIRTNIFDRIYMSEIRLVHSPRPKKVKYGYNIYKLKQNSVEIHTGATLLKYSSVHCSDLIFFIWEDYKWFYFFFIWEDYKLLSQKFIRISHWHRKEFISCFKNVHLMCIEFTCYSPNRGNPKNSGMSM